jgi:hypothetical protein
MGAGLVFNNDDERRTSVPMFIATSTQRWTWARTIRLGAPVVVPLEYLCTLNEDLYEAPVVGSKCSRAALTSSRQARQATENDGLSYNA